MRLFFKLLAAGAFVTVGAVAQAQEVRPATQGHQEISVHAVLGNECWDLWCEPPWNPYEIQIQMGENGG